MWLDNPIAGIGIGMFPSELKLYPNPQYSYYFSHGLVAHNMYVSMLAETGIIGAFLFLALLVSAFVNFVKARKLTDKAFNGIQKSRLFFRFSHSERAGRGEGAGKGSLARAGRCLVLGRA